jgi:hypothetical protein
LNEKAGKEPAKADANEARRFDPALILPSQTQRWDALGLAAQKGNDCQRAPPEATRLVAFALQLRRDGVVSSPDRRGQIAEPRVKSLTQFMGRRLGISSEQGPSAEMIAALVQTLQAEEESSRGLLVDLLSLSDSPAATAALAQRALYDLSPLVRAQAVQALKARPQEPVRKILLEGFRYPWPVVADHAAEALIALGDRAAVPALQRLATEPDPGLPIVKPGAGNKALVREVVRLNHLKNCLLCHAPAVNIPLRTEFVAPVPTPGKELPVAYYASRSGGDLLVRADISYLRQDFSVMQPVADAQPWPAVQRFDFLVREREATANELEWLKNPPATYPQREAVLWALKELSK